MYKLSSTKRKRVVLSIHDKQQVLQRLEGGEQPIAIAQEFGISRQQVSDIKKNKERILAYCTDAKCISTLKRKTLNPVPQHHPGVEQELYRWIIRQRKLGRHVSAHALSTKTADLFMQYSSTNVPLSLTSMTTWLRHFKKAYGLKVVSENEVQQLPEQFVPAMYVARPDETTGSVQLKVEAPTTSTQATIDLIRVLNKQVTQTQRDILLKLDELDERVAKLCYVLHPTARLSEGRVDPVES
ncbi:hypothetical protein PsorP6_007723 [Peronosclerospora sorghi]|uniref:Uncharacterized protein n=1 Tax=Peronosclerospora sorghi TaxID=230839 RepID=A0ACC0W9K8_9STRA|nr:hypothetical protein PsorP6_007723 [Peronosclerospora sorghi]